MFWLTKLKTIGFAKLLYKTGESRLVTSSEDMEKSNLIHREVFAEVPPRVEYSLTDIS